jgi:hypothetical protein
MNPMARVLTTKAPARPPSLRLGRSLTNPANVLRFKSDKWERSHLINARGTLRWFLGNLNASWCWTMAVKPAFYKLENTLSRSTNRKVGV